jgi:hypothetical protein
VGRRKGSYNIVLGPEQLATLREVFDAVWAEVVSDYDASAASTEVGRLRLANALLAAHRRGVSGMAALRALGRRRMVMWRHQLRIVRQPTISMPTTALGGFGQAQGRVVTPKINGRKTGP